MKLMRTKKTVPFLGHPVGMFEGFFNIARWAFFHNLARISVKLISFNFLFYSPRAQAPLN